MKAVDSQTAPLLDVRDLRKTYGSRMAVDGAGFCLYPGQMVGLLGPNGAGKTTIISMIAGLVAPDSGVVRVGGREFADDRDPVKALIGLVPQDLALYDDATAEENLSFFGGLQCLGASELRRAIDDALAFVGLADRRRDRVQTYSGGMKRRLNLAAALLHDPALLLLDEPTVGVDPQSRNAIFDNVAALRDRGKTILYTTHYMEEVERLCERVIVVDHGRIIADDGLDALKRRFAKANELTIELERPLDAAGLAELQAIPGLAQVLQEGARLRIFTVELTSAGASVLAVLAERKAVVRSMQAQPPSLEAVFLELTGRTLRDP
jgi:ABC-2 type transport system ATP-binding protein